MGWKWHCYQPWRKLPLSFQNKNSFTDHTFCYRLKGTPRNSGWSPKLSIWCYLEKGGSWEVIRSWEWGPHGGISGLLRGDAMWRCSMKRAICKPGRELSPGPETARTVRNEHLLFQAPSPGYFVTPAQRTNTPCPILSFLLSLLSAPTGHIHPCSPAFSATWTDFSLPTEFENLCQLLQWCLRYYHRIPCLSLHEVNPIIQFLRQAFPIVWTKMQSCADSFISP